MASHPLAPMNDPEEALEGLTEQHEAMSHDELAELLAEDERLAVSFRDTTLSAEQAVAIDYYEAQPFGDEVEGLSQVVTPEVAEVVDYMTISVARTVVSSGNVVEFESAEHDAEEAAQEATAAVSYTFMKAQDGFRIINDWIQSGLIEKIGIIKTCAETCRKTVKKRGMVDEAQLAAIMAVPNVKLIAADDNGDGTYLIEVAEQSEETKFLDLPIPSEEFLFASRTRHEDDADYLCHRSAKTESDLLEMGFDRELIEGLPEDNGTGQFDSRSVARWRDETQTRTPGLKKFMLNEEYKRVDMDGDGYAELVQVFRVGNTILSVEEVDEAPFVIWCPFPRAHRLVGNSLADKTMDLQRIKSVLLRQQMNGLFLTNNPRMYVPEPCIGDNTIDDLLTVRPGGLVRGKTSDGPKPLYEPFDMSKGMAMLQYITGERESRTGITRLNQGLDADALNKTATGTALLQAQGQQVEEYVARNFVEALARLFGKKLRLMQKVGKPFSIKVDGVAKTVDPSQWPDGLSASARVGLGSGRKDQRLTFRNELLDLQKQGLPVGLSNEQLIYRNLAGACRDMDFNPNEFFLDPDSPEGQAAAAKASQQGQSQPDPAIQKAQAQIAFAQAKAGIEQQRVAGLLQIKQAESQMRLEHDRQKAAGSLDLESQKAAAEAQLAARKQELEYSLSQQELAAEQALAHRKALIDHVVRIAAPQGISADRPGGRLDQ